MEVCRYKLPCGLCGKVDAVECDTIECETVCNLSTKNRTKTQVQKTDNSANNIKTNDECQYHKLELKEIRTVGKMIFDIYVCRKCGEVYMCRHIER